MENGENLQIPEQFLLSSRFARAGGLTAEWLENGTAPSDGLLNPAIILEALPEHYGLAAPLPCFELVATHPPFLSNSPI